VANVWPDRPEAWVELGGGGVNIGPRLRGSDRCGTASGPFTSCTGRRRVRSAPRPRASCSMLPRCRKRVCGGDCDVGAAGVRPLRTIRQSSFHASGRAVGAVVGEPACISAASRVRGSRCRPQAVRRLESETLQAEFFARPGRHHNFPRGWVLFATGGGREGHAAPIRGAPPPMGSSDPNVWSSGEYRLTVARRMLEGCRARGD
jgi:hypothetical protein